MNCFDWQNHLSDYLDGSLPDAMKQAAKVHLDSCKDCSEKCKHFQVILSSIASQPRTPLPLPIRKAPLSAALPRIEPSKLSFSTWELIPWYIRIPIEAAGIILGVFLVITATPKIRTLYEMSFEKSLTDFREELNLTEPHLDKEEHSIPPLQTAQSHSVSHSASQTTSGSEHDDLSGEDDSEEDDSDQNKNLHVGRSELWRFTLKTVSPDELRPQVVKTLTGLGVSEKTLGLGGMQVPGGIEFDLVLPQSLVADIKHALQKLAPHTSSEDQQTPPGSENFTWYRVKSKRKIPEGTSQVVIWLSQPH